MDHGAQNLPMGSIGRGGRIGLIVVMAVARPRRGHRAAALQKGRAKLAAEKHADSVAARDDAEDGLPAAVDAEDGGFEAVNQHCQLGIQDGLVDIADVAPEIEWQFAGFLQLIKTTLESKSSDH